jgi:hypothetical protein
MKGQKFRVRLCSGVDLLLSGSCEVFDFDHSDRLNGGLRVATILGETCAVAFNAAVAAIIVTTIPMIAAFAEFQSCRQYGVIARHALI